MARIATCKCSLEFYDSTGTATLCTRCERNAQEKAKRRQKAARHVARLRRGKENSLNFAFIQCHWRYQLPIWECAEVLDISEEQAHAERDIAKQNAR